MDIRIAVPDETVSAPVLDAGLEAVTRLNQRLLEKGRVPSFREAIRRGVRWRPEPPGDESFDHAAKVIGRGWGDCDDLAPYRAADLRTTGEDRGARAAVYKSGPSRWHAVVQRSDGRVEDPSQTAGMNPGKASQGIPPSVVGVMFRGSEVSGGPRPALAVRRVGAVYQARTDVPWNFTDYAMASLQKGATPTSALVGSILGACMLGDASSVCDEGHVAKLYAVAGLLSGRPREALCERLGDDVVGEAEETIRAIGVRAAGVPFARRLCAPVRPARVVPVPVVGDIFGDISHAVSNVAHDVSNVAKSVAHIAQPILNVAHVILSTAQGVISLIPGIGTGISAAIGAGLAILEGGGPLEIAIKTAYGAIPIPPGVRTFTDMVLDAGLSLMQALTSGESLAQSAITSAVQGARQAVLDKLPDVAKGIGASVFDTLTHLLLQAVHAAPTLAVTAQAKPSAAYVKSIQAAHAAGLPMPVGVKRIAPTAQAHAGLHLALSLRAKGAPANALAPSVASVATYPASSYLVWGASVMVPK